MTFSLKRTLRVRMASRSRFGRPLAIGASVRDDQAFLVHLLAEARALAAANIHVMDAVDGEANQPVSPMEGGRHDEDVGGLAVARPKGRCR